MNWSGYPPGVTQESFDREADRLSEERSGGYAADRIEADERDLDLIARGVCLSCGGDIRGRYMTPKYNCRCGAPYSAPRYMHLKEKYHDWKYYRHLFTKGEKP